MPKKKFINKKKAVTFQLVHRSQQDPLIADEDAPQRVLQQVKKETPEERAQRIEEQHKYGIFFTDDTNYLEFLRERSDFRAEWPENVEKELEERKNRIYLPKEVFASQKLEKVGMLNKDTAETEPIDVDPDILAALEDDFNFDDPENQLEDDFIELAEGFVSDQEKIEEDEMECDDESSCENSEQNEECEIGSQDDESWETNSEDNNSCQTESEDRCKSRFTFSKDPKEAHQQMLEKQVQRMLKEFDEIEKESDDQKVGMRLTEEETEILLGYGEEFEKSRQLLQLDKDDEANSITKEMAKRKNAFKTTYVEVNLPEKMEYDSQSIISTYSRTKHLPKVLEWKPRKIIVSEKTGMPINVLGQKKLTSAALERHNAQNEENRKQGPQSVHTIASRVEALSIRDKNESSEEKRERKQALKEYRRERRIEKKQNKLAFAADFQKLKKSQNASKRAFTLGI